MSTRCHLKIAIAIVLACGMSPRMQASDPAQASVPQVTVDAAKVVGQVPGFTLYTNTSLRFVPPHELAAQVEREYGKPHITRVWLPLDDMWDYRDNSYHFNFEIGKDIYTDDAVKSKYDRGEVLPSNVLYYDHLNEFSSHSDYLLLNVRRYEAEVISGKISLDKWKEVLKTGLLHYKARYKNIRYIEVLNEWHIRDFGGISDKDYYQFYKACYQIVNEVNDQLKPDIPLEVGGPNVVGEPLDLQDVGKAPKSWNKTVRIYHFLQVYAADPDPRKKLDFISFHDYDLGKDFSAIRTYEASVRKLLDDFKLNQDLPIFITEIGYAGVKPNPELNQRQATGMSELFYYSRGERQLHLFPWALYHEPARQLNLTAYVLKPDLRMTPFGEVLKMWSMQQKNELESNWTSPVKGLNALASRDGNTLVLQIWNDNAEAHSAAIKIPALASVLGHKVRVREYLVDSHNNNVLLTGNGGTELDATSDKVLTKTQNHWSVSLEPYSAAMWKIERVD